MISIVSKERIARPFKNIEEFWQKSEIDVFNSNVITIALKKDFNQSPVPTVSFTLDYFKVFAKDTGFKKLFDDYIYLRSGTRIFVSFAVSEQIEKTIRPFKSIDEIWTVSELSPKTDLLTVARIEDIDLPSIPTECLTPEEIPDFIKKYGGFEGMAKRFKYMPLKGGFVGFGVEVE